MKMISNKLEYDLNELFNRSTVVVDTHANVYINTDGCILMCLLFV